jgi:hypothetical protein
MSCFGSIYVWILKYFYTTSIWGIGQNKSSATSTSDNCDEKYTSNTQEWDCSI